MALSLTVKDNANGTSVLATVAGSSAGTVTIYKATATASAIGSFASAGTRSGDGTVTLTTSPGYFYWYAQEGAGTPTAHIYRPATSAGDSVWDRCITMLASWLGTLTLPGTPTILSKLWPEYDDTAISFPLIDLSVVGLSEEKDGGTIGQDDIVYPVNVFAIEKTPADLEANRARYLNWRDQIDRSADNGVTDYRVPELMWCQVQPGTLIDVEKLTSDRIRFSLQRINCRCRRTRGTSVLHTTSTP